MYGKTTTTMRSNIKCKKILVGSLWSITDLIVGCLQCASNDNNKYYSAEDFYKIKKIDVHAHALVPRPDFVQQAKQDNFILISVNVEVPDYPPVDSQRHYVLQFAPGFSRQYLPGDHL
jgi:hypothetical protein